MDNRYKWPMHQRGAFVEQPGYVQYGPRFPHQYPYKNYKRPNHNSYSFNKHHANTSGPGYYKATAPPPLQQQQQSAHSRGGGGLSQIPLPESGHNSSGSDVVTLIMENKTLKHMIVLHLDVMRTQNESLLDKDKELEDQNGRIKTLLAQNQELMQQIAKLSHTIEDLRKEFRKQLKRGVNDNDEQPKTKYQCFENKETQTLALSNTDTFQEGHIHTTHVKETQNAVVTSVTDLPPTAPIAENNKCRNEFNGGKKVISFFMHRVHQEEEEQQQDEEQQLEGEEQHQREDEQQSQSKKEDNEEKTPQTEESQQELHTHIEVAIEKEADGREEEAEESNKNVEHEEHKEHEENMSQEIHVKHKENDDYEKHGDHKKQEETVKEKVMEQEVLEEQVVQEKEVQEQEDKHQVIKEQVVEEHEEQVVEEHEEQVVEEHEEQVVEEQVVEEHQEQVVQEHQEQVVQEHQEQVVQEHQEQVDQEQVDQEQVVQEHVVQEQMVEEQFVEQHVVEEQVLEEQIEMEITQDDEHICNEAHEMEVATETVIGAEEELGAEETTAYSADPYINFEKIRDPVNCDYIDIAELVGNNILERMREDNKLNKKRIENKGIRALKHLTGNDNYFADKLMALRHIRDQKNESKITENVVEADEHPPSENKEHIQSEQQENEDRKETEEGEGIGENIEEETKRKLQWHLQKQKQRLQSQQQQLPLVRLKKSPMQSSGSNLIYPPIAQTSATITPAPSPTNAFALSPSLPFMSSGKNTVTTATTMVTATATAATAITTTAAAITTTPAETTTNTTATETPATTTAPTIIHTPLTPQSVCSVGSNSSIVNNYLNNKHSVVNNCIPYNYNKSRSSKSNSKFLTSEDTYITRSWEDQEFHCDNEFFLEEADELLADNPSLEIPKWKVIKKTPCTDSNDTEPLSDLDFVRRHEKHVRDELERKKRDARYIREQMRSEALRVRHNQDEVLVPLEPLPISTFYPLPEDIEAIEYVADLPVQAFGENIVNLKSEIEPNFTLPWLEAVSGATASAREKAAAMPVATLASKKLPTSATEARHQEMNSSYVFIKRKKRQRRR